MSGSTKPSIAAISNVQRFVAFSIVAYAIYFPAVGGQFVSDDVHYVQANAYVHELSVENVVAILDPFGPLPRVVENYAPVHLLLHGLAWQAFDADVRGHHLVNIFMHALASCLLVVLFRRSGIPALAALLAGALFLVHPANVEAVAWINQLKTTSAMVLCLSALLLHPRRPFLGVLAFALALLAKPTAAVALFVVAAFGLCRPQPQPASGAPETSDWRWGWVAAWGLAFVVFSILELGAFEQTAGQHRTLYADLGVRVRTLFAVALRYLVMAPTSYGVSVFQEPDGAESLFDPWWLASLPVLGALAWRAAVVLRGRAIEGAYWIWAAASFAPVCGLIPLPHVIADRYLYFMLPGLLGGASLAGAALARKTAFDSVRPALGRAGVVLAVLWIAAFAVRSYERAFVWQSAETVTADVMEHYPEGRWASVELAARAAAAGDVEGAVARLRNARERGFDKLDVLLGPRYAALRAHPEFRALQEELAAAWIERVAAIREPTQHDLMYRAQAYIAQGELEAARADLRRAIYVGGPMTDYLYGALDQLAELERARSARPGSD